MASKKAKQVIQILKFLYPDALCSLEYRKPHELLISARLSAQCTDARVNVVTKELFARYPTLEAFAEADLDELTALVRPCGFFNTKARDIKNASALLLKKYGGVIPDTLEELVKLPGVGRKTANLLLGDLYRKPAVVADTHCIRLSNRIGFCGTQDPYKVELALKKLIPPAEQSDLCHRFFLHGRALCPARAPQCGACPIRPWCDFGKARQT